MTPADRNIIEVNGRDSIFITIQISEKVRIVVPGLQVNKNQNCKL